MIGREAVPEKVLLKHVRGIYCQEAPVNDIQKQLDGTPFLMDIDTADPITERSRIAKAFFSGSIPLVTEDRSRRVEAIKDLTALCALSKVRHRYPTHQRGPPLNTNNEEPFPMEGDPLEDEPLEGGPWEGEPERLGCISLIIEPLQCILCLGERSLGTRQKLLFSAACIASKLYGNTSGFARTGTGAGPLATSSFLPKRLFMLPRHSRQYTPSFPNPSLGPGVIDILVGRCIDVCSASAFPIRGFVSDLFALLRHLIEKLMLWTVD